MFKTVARSIQLVILLVTLLVLVIVGIHAYAGISAVVQAQQIQQEFGELTEHATALDFESARSDVESMQASFEVIENRLQLAFLGGWIPGARTYHATGLSVSRAGIHVTDALLEGVNIAEEVTVNLKSTGLEGTEVESILAYNELSTSEKLELLRAFRNQGDALRRMQTSLHLAQGELGGTSEDLPPFIIDVINPIKEGLNSIIEMVDLFTPLSLSLNEIAGVEESKTWMTLFLNNNELRPGGGFIGVAGLAEVDKAEITNLAISDSYSLDAPLEVLDSYTLEAPQPIQTYTGVQKWYFRDSNWSPDFETSSEYGISIFSRAASALNEAGLTEVSGINLQNPEIDGVVGFTLSVAEDVLEVTGPVEVDGIIFDSENIRDALQFEVSFGYEGRGLEKDERKEIVSKLTQEVFNKLLALPITKWPDLFDLIQSNVEEGQIALYSTDERTQKLFEDQGWAGTINHKEGQDLMMVVDSNMIAKKTDPYVERSINYTVEPQTQSSATGSKETVYVAKVEATYQHTGNFTLTESRYRDYVRLYAPGGSTLTSYTGFMENDPLNDPEGNPGTVTTEEESGMQVFGGFFSLEPGETKTITWTYELPAAIAESIKEGRYVLMTPKQLGAFEKNLYLNLSFDAKVKSAIPPEKPGDFGDKGYTYETVLNSSQKFIVEL